MIIRHKIGVFKLCQLCFSNEDLTAPQLKPLSKLCFVFHLINSLYRDSYHHHNLSALVLASHRFCMQVGGSREAHLTEMSNYNSMCDAGL